MLTPELIKEHWTALKPKVRELWPDVTEQDVQAVHGDGELLVTKVRDRYAISREEILNRLAPYVPVTAPR